MELVPKAVVVALNKKPNKNRQNAEWRKGLNSVPKRWAATLKTSLKRFPHDITFSVGDKTIPCHKFVLAIASPFFEDLIEESEKLGQSVIEVIGFDLAVFNNIIQHAYMEENLVMEEKDLAATMSAAHLCEIQELEDICATILKHGLSSKNAVTSFQEADSVQNAQLLDSAYGFILKHFDEILDSEDFLCFTKDHLCTFLKSDDLHAPSETDVFKGVMRWGEHQCKLQGKDNTIENLRGVLDGVLRHIRMPSIPSDDFMSIIEPSDLFNPEEKINLFRYFWPGREIKDRNLLLTELGLSVSVRQAKLHDEVVDLISGLLLDGEDDAINFDNIYGFTIFKIDGDERDPPVYLKGVGFVGRPSKPTEIITIKLKITSYSSGMEDATIFSTMETTYTSEACKLFMIDLKKSVRIIPNKKYEVCYLPLSGGIAQWKTPKTKINFIVNNKIDTQAKAIKLTVTASQYEVYSLKFSHFE